MAGLSKVAQERLLRSGDFSDFKITCHGKEWRVHKGILCAGSNFFDKMCKSGFKESLESAVDLPEEDPEVLDRVIKYVYTGVLDESPLTSCFICRNEMVRFTSGKSAQTRDNTQASEDAQKEDGHHNKGTDPSSRSCAELATHAVCHSTMLFLEVYVCADRLHFGRLKDVSSELFLQRAQGSDVVSGGDFARIVDYVLQYTQAESVPLLLTLTCHNILRLCDQETLDMFRKRVPAQAKLAEMIQAQMVAAKDERQKAVADLEAKTVAYDKLAKSGLAVREGLEKAIRMHQKLDLSATCSKCYRGTYQFQAYEAEGNRYTFYATPPNAFLYKLKCDRCGSEWTE